MKKNELKKNKTDKSKMWQFVKINKIAYYLVSLINGKKKKNTEEIKNMQKFYLVTGNEGENLNEIDHLKRNFKVLTRNQEETI